MNEHINRCIQNYSNFQWYGELRMLPSRVSTLRAFTTTTKRTRNMLTNNAHIKYNNNKKMHIIRQIQIFKFQLVVVDLCSAFLFNWSLFEEHQQRVHNKIRRTNLKSEKAKNNKQKCHVDNLLANFEDNLLQKVWEFLNDRHRLARCQANTIHRCRCIVSRFAQTCRCITALFRI